MINPEIFKVYRSKKGNQLFSLLIPSWNNLPYLRLCIESIRKNSHFKHQIIVLINEGNDGTLSWVKSQADIDYVYAKENLGICYGLNACRQLIVTDYVLYINDDMYLLPRWDVFFWEEVQAIGHKAFMLSGTMVEPLDTGNNCVIVQDYGDNPDNFREKDLLDEFESLKKNDWSGSTWPPVLVPLELWDLVGGMSTEFSPGMYSDPDFSMKLWNSGVRYFKGLGQSRVYHFGSKTTRRVNKNEGRKRFLIKYGVSARSFLSCYLKRGDDFSGPLQEARLSYLELIKNKFKLMIYAIKAL